MPLEDRVIHLRATGVSLVLSFRGKQPPEVVHWGRDLGDVPEAALRGLADAHEAPFDGNAPNEPLRPSLVPVAGTGWMGRPGLVGHRLDGSAWAPSFEVVELCWESEALPDGVRCVTLADGTLVVDLCDVQSALTIRISIEMLPEGLARVGAEVTNTAAADYWVDELSVALPVPVSADEILDFSGRWGREREPVRLPVTLGCHLNEGRHGRTGFDAAMMMFAGQSGFGFESGEVWGLHTAFSGNHRTWVERLNNGRQVIGGGELLMPGEIRLARDESYATPWIYLGYGDGLDEVARRVHTFLRRQPGHPDTARPVTLNVWEAVYFDHDLTKLQQLADTAAAIGVERYVLDDGWFLGRRHDRAGLGDWVVDPAVWPQGLHPLIDHVRSLGMEFGLWVEPEMVNLDSDIARLHPEWLMAGGERLPVEWRQQQVLNIAIPEAYEYVRGRLLALLDEYDIAYFKWDHNRDLIDAGNQLDAGRAAVHEQTLAAYQLMDDLRAAHPELEIESCSSGGGRIDLEMARHASRFWLSDCIDPHERQLMMRWTSQLIPPEQMGTHIASPHSHTTGRVSNLSFRAGTAIWGHLGIEWDISSLSEDESTELAEWLGFYKENRDFLLSGDLVRSDRVEESLWVQGVLAPDRSRGLYELVTRRRSPLSPRGKFRLPGLRPEALYRVRPVLVGGGPEGLFAPGWFAADGKGVELTGAMLSADVLHTPLLYPDQVLIIEAEEIATATHP